MRRAASYDLSKMEKRLMERHWSNDYSIVSNTHFAFLTILIYSDTYKKIFYGPPGSVQTEEGLLKAEIDGDSIL